MSFSSLPTELVRQIIESSVPSTFHSTTYRDRQATLLSLCLVSRRFFSIAQPTLFEIVWINSFDKLDDILDKVESKGWLDVIRDMKIADPGDVRPRTAQMERLARAGLRLQNLRIDVWTSDTLDCKVLQDFPNAHPITRSFGSCLLRLCRFEAPPILGIYFTLLSYHPSYTRIIQLGLRGFTCALDHAQSRSSSFAPTTRPNLDR